MHTAIPYRTKVFAYIIDRDRLLVFRHPDSPEAGIQVPAGTVQHGEMRVDALMREIQEETGLSHEDFILPAQYLGQAEFDARPWGKHERHHRHFYLLRISKPQPEQWSHWEAHAEGLTQAVAFDFFWMPLQDAPGQLIAAHDALLHKIPEKISESLT